MRLLDVNVLLANSLQSHEHHLVVQDWLNRFPDMPVATCALTEASLLRLLMNPAINEDPIDAETAIELLVRLHRHARHRFLNELPSPCDPATAEFMSRIRGYRQVTDAYLVAIARANDGKLATLDRKLAELYGSEELEIIEA
jgi:toxin-antitoxin system PIN domain toxin